MTGRLLAEFAAAWSLATFAACALVWQARSWLADRQRERDAALWRAALDAAEANRPVPYQLSRAGWLDMVPYGPAATIPAETAVISSRARIEHAERLLTWWEVQAEVAALIADVEAHPERWRDRP